VYTKLQCIICDPQTAQDTAAILRGAVKHDESELERGRMQSSQVGLQCGRSTSMCNGGVVNWMRILHAPHTLVLALFFVTSCSLLASIMAMQSSRVMETSGRGCVESGSARNYNGFSSPLFIHEKMQLPSYPCPFWRSFGRLHAASLLAHKATCRGRMMERSCGAHRKVARSLHLPAVLLLLGIFLLGVGGQIWVRTRHSRVLQDAVGQSNILRFEVGPGSERLQGEGDMPGSRGQAEHFDRCCISTGEERPDSEESTTASGLRESG